PGQLIDTIEHELRARPVFLVILSPAALRSQWVRDETKWAFLELRRDPSHLLLPVLAAPVAERDIWLFLQDFKRIEAPGVTPYSLPEAINRTLQALALTRPGEAPAPTVPQPAESAEDLIERGKALNAQQQSAEAWPLFERATQLAPNSFDAWFNLGYTGYLLKRPLQEQLVAYERATTLDPNNAVAWSNKGSALHGLKRYAEALAACDRALALDPDLVVAWYNKGGALGSLKRYDEALAACDRALALDPNSATTWYNKGNALSDLKRFDEALATLDRALALD